MDQPLTSISDLYNPYDFSNPVLDAQLFAGRQKEMEEIQYYMEQAKKAPRAINLALLGRRASGKTSVLNMTERLAIENGFCAVRVNLDEDDALTQQAFFFKVFDAVFQGVCEFGTYGGIGSETHETYIDMVSSFTVPKDKKFCPFQFPIQYAKARAAGNVDSPVSEPSLKADLTRLHKDLNRLIVLLFDECNVLAKSKVHLQKLRNLFMNTPGYMLVITGTPDLFETMDEVFSPIIRQFKKITIGEFSDQGESRDCIRRPLKTIGLDPDLFIDMETFRDVHELAGGRPYEIQLICHTMFQRLQKERGSRFKLRLDVAVIEEIRNLLESYQDVTARPVLTAIRQYRKKRLRALSAFVRHDGRTTFEQVFFTQHAFFDDVSWARDELRHELDLLIRSKVVVEDDDGIIRFTGDEFDKIYTKYLARERGVPMQFTDFPVTFTWDFMLEQSIVTSEQLEGRIEVERGSFAQVFDQRRSYDIKEIGRELGDLKSDDVFEKYPNSALLIYKALWKTPKDGCLRIIRVNMRTKWMSRHRLFVPIDPADSEIGAAVMGVVHNMNNRMLDVDGELTADILDIPYVAPEVLIQKAKEATSARVRNSLGHIHTDLAVNTYKEHFDRSNPLYLTQAVQHAQLAMDLDYQFPAEEANNIGYIFLAKGNIRLAQRMFLETIELSTKTAGTESDGTDTSALARYNLAVAYVTIHDYASARDHLTQCMARLRTLAPSEQDCACLFVPTFHGGKLDGKLEFEEQEGPNLYEAAKALYAALEHVLD